MIKQKIHKGISCFLAIFIFFSASNLAADVHFCSDDIYSISLFGHANSCKKKKDRNNHETYLDKVSCCSSSQFKIETSKEYKQVYIQDTEYEQATYFYFNPNSTATKVVKEVDSRQKIPSPPDEITSNSLYKEFESFLI